MGQALDCFSVLSISSVTFMHLRIEILNKAFEDGKIPALDIASTMELVGSEPQVSPE